jgi:RimJ/RimL family protein N-acetyltransferase
MIHARKIATVIAGHRSFQIDIDGQTVTVVPRTTSREIHRYKAAAHSGGSGTWGLPDRSSLDVPVIALRPVADSDLGPLFDQMRDPESVRMAAFTPDDPDNRTAFDAHMATVRSSPDITLRAVTCDNHLVGSIAAFVLDGRTEVTYWIDRAAWGHGIASRALELLLDLIPVRPLHARVASDNAASLRVLQKLGFKVTGTENSFAPGRNSNIEETILRKD